VRRNLGTDPTYDVRRLTTTKAAAARMVTVTAIVNALSLLSFQGLRLGSGPPSVTQFLQTFGHEVPARQELRVQLPRKSDLPR
jgi:hypothetical protein